MTSYLDLVQKAIHNIITKIISNCFWRILNISCFLLIGDDGFVTHNSLIRLPNVSLSGHRSGISNTYMYIICLISILHISDY